MSLPEPKPGDLIEIFHIVYEHWAIYVGDGYVVHLTAPRQAPGDGSSSISLVWDGRAVVRQERLEKVVKGWSYEVNNHLDRKYRPLPVEEIVSSAKKMIGEEVSYSLLDQNCKHFVTDLRYGKPLNRQSLPEPKPGDLIEIFRIVYEHWAIYVGDGYVVHLTAPRKIPGAGSRAVVRQERLEEVAKGWSYEVNNHMDHKYRPLPVEEIVSSAKKKVGEEVSYSVLGWNCEHFVTDLRYSKPLSRQVKWLHDVGVSDLLENLGIVEEYVLKEDAEK